MTRYQLEIDGQSAREAVRRLWPNATSSYVSATVAEIYDPASNTVLGLAEAEEFVVDVAWIAAANRLSM